MINLKLKSDNKLNFSPTKGFLTGNPPNICRALKYIAFLCLLMMNFATESWACGGIFDVRCNLSHGGMSPGNIVKQTEHAAQDVGKTVEKAGQDVGNALNELQASGLSGPALEQAIIASRNTAVNGSMPIPWEIRQMLTGYASEDSMNRARYKIGDNGFVNLAHLLEQGGFASAVTLIDVIVFRGPSEAADPSIWAHELHHVDQYRDWGSHSFAVQYTRNYHGVENPAYEKGNNFWTWHQSQRQFVPASNQIQWPNSPPPQQGVGSFCYTAAGKYGPGPVQTIGTPCWVQLPAGNFPGSVGF